MSLHAVAHDIERDLDEPWTELECEYALRRIGGERTIGPREGILRHLFGVLTTAAEPQRKAKEPMLICQHQLFEGDVKIGGQRGGQFRVCQHSIRLAWGHTRTPRSCPIHAEGLVTRSIP